MKTVRTKRIVAELDGLQFGYWDMENEEFVPIENMSTEEIRVVAEKMGVKPLLLDTLSMFSDSIREMVGKDLEDIWERLGG
jgi:hypothetical protein